MHPKMKARRERQAKMAAVLAGEEVETEEVETEEVETEEVETEEVETEEVANVSIEDMTEEMLVTELRDRASKLEISGRSSMNKAELIAAINEVEGDA